MNSQIKLLVMTKQEMAILKICAAIAVLFSAAIACASVAITRFYSLRTNTDAGPGAPERVPVAFVVAEICFDALLFMASVFALLSRFLRGSESSGEELANQQKATTLPLAASALYSFPFRGIAGLSTKKEVPNPVLLFGGDVLATIGTSMIFFYLWLYPFLCASLELPVNHLGRKARPIPQLCTPIVYAFLKTLVSLIFKIHFKPLPLQNLFALAGLLLQGAWANVKAWNTVALLCISGVEVGILLAITWGLSIHSRLLVNTIDPSSHQAMIAIRYFQRSAALLFVNVLLIAAASAFASPLQGLHVLQETGNLLLSQLLGNSAVSLAIASYAAREYYVHHSWKRSGIAMLISRFFSALIPGKRDASQAELVYRVSDERDPLTEFPVPQENTFSLETATLLFNMCWLTTTYSELGMKLRAPADFGRPFYTLYSHVGDEQNRASAIILQGMDRVIVAFRPVSGEAQKQSNLKPLSKTSFGKFVCAQLSKSENIAKNVTNKSIRLFRRSKVHAGFETVYSSIQHQIIRDVSALLKQKRRPVYVTGYASGGAVATLCVLDLNLRHLFTETQLNSVYTFGSLKVMNSAMVHFFHIHAPFRWRCLVSGDSFALQPVSPSFRHASKIATFTRNGHLAIEFTRALKWWQSPVSVHPMHKLSAYYCALENWHSAFHIKRPIDLWDWTVDKTVKALFKHQNLLSDSRWPLDSALDSPTPDIESRSVRKLEPYFAASVSDAEADDVVAFSR